MGSYKHYDQRVIKKRSYYRSHSGRNATHEVYIQKTNRHLVVVLYGKSEKRDLLSCSTRVSDVPKFETRFEAAKWVGQVFAQKCQKIGISQIYFNKLNYKFHGLVAQVINSIRESGVNV